MYKPRSLPYSSLTLEIIQTHHLFTSPWLQQVEARGLPAAAWRPLASSRRGVEKRVFTCFILTCSGCFWVTEVYVGA